MKIKPADFAALKAACEPLNTEANREAYRTGNFPRSASVKDVNKRFRWDVLYASGLNISALYTYMTDDHIDTALRAIIPAL